MTEYKTINDLEEALEKFIKNQIQIKELKEKYFDKIEKDVEFIKIISNISIEKRELFFENEEILNNSVFFYKNNINLINEDIYLIFLKFAHNLSVTAYQIDTPIAYEVFDFLYKYSRKLNDRNKIIINAYNCGLALFNIDNRLLSSKIKEYFAASLEFKDQYFDLDKQARYYFNRAYGNLYATDWVTRVNDFSLYLQKTKEIIDFWSRKDIRDYDPDFNFDTFILIAKRNALTILDEIRKGTSIGKEDMKTLYKYSKDIYNLRLSLVANTQIPVQFNYQYSYFAMRYHMGYISIDELLNSLEEISNPIESDIYSLESSTRIIRGNTYYVEYLNFAKYDKDYVYNKKKEIFKTVNQYIASVPSNISGRLLQNEIVAYLKVFTADLDEEDTINGIIELTTYRHLPTFVHITMVSNISELILKAILEYKPEFLIETLDLNSVEDVIKNSNRLLDTIKKSSLLHDIGKFFCLEYISNFGRKLTDIEFTIIKNHPQIGYDLLKASKVSDIYVEAVLLHHSWHNIKGGYPLVKEEVLPKLKTKKLIDIITIADSLDAATDHLGRPYARRKTLKEVINEFSNEAGTRYSAELVELIKIPKLNEELKNLVSNGRINVTLTAYKLFIDRNHNKK